MVGQGGTDQAKDTALYQSLLGLQSPWTVSRVTLNVQGQRVDVWAEHAETVTWTCPHCAKTLPLYDHAEERTRRHLDSCQFQTYLMREFPAWFAASMACGFRSIEHFETAIYFHCGGLDLYPC